MKIFKDPFTFDRVVRGVLFLTVVVVLVMAFRYLSPVLVPFLLAWAFAWLLAPMVDFIDHKMHFPGRMISIITTLVVCTLVVAGVLSVTIPIFVEGFTQLKEGILDFITGRTHVELPNWLERYLDDYIGSLELDKLLKQENLVGALKNTMPHVWQVVLSTYNVFVGLASLFFAVLYFIFILKDYGKFSTGWQEYIPESKRAFFVRLTHDVAVGMRGYFRGQGLVALSNMIMFTLGFWLMGLKMWLGMGIFVGCISFIPYVQVVGFIPAAILALLEMAEGGRPFWLVMLLVLLVYGVVQVIQDAVVTPRVMGKIMGLSPALILLSLSVWGFVGGVVGLIVALPLTTILIAYYKEYIIGTPPTPRPAPNEHNPVAAE